MNHEKPTGAFEAVVMIVLLISAGLLWSIGPPVHAQVVPGTPGWLAFNHDGLITDRYELTIDGGPPMPVTVTKGQGALLGAFLFPWPVVSPGQHTFQIFACNAAGCSGNIPPFVYPPSLPLTKPAVPTNVRVEFP